MKMNPQFRTESDSRVESLTLKMEISTHRAERGAKARVEHVHTCDREALEYDCSILTVLIDHSNNEKPFPLMEQKTLNQPQTDYIPMNIQHKVPNLKGNSNTFWYKGKRFQLSETEYALAESIYGFMFQNGETPWN